MSLNRRIIKFEDGILEGVNYSFVLLKESINSVIDLMNEIRSLFDINESIYLSTKIGNKQVFIPPKAHITSILPEDEIIVHRGRDSCLMNLSIDTEACSPPKKKKKHKKRKHEMGDPDAEGRPLSDDQDDTLADVPLQCVPDTVCLPLSEHPEGLQED